MANHMEIVLANIAQDIRTMKRELTEKELADFYTRLYKIVANEGEEK